MSANPPHLHLTVFLASPGDVPAERNAAREIMESVLPKDRLLPCTVSFDVVAWDHPGSGTPMPAHLTPQEAVIRFKARPAKCDIVLVILRDRLGTQLDVSRLKKPDGSAYLSGTEWEFEDAWNADPRPEIMVYRGDTVTPIQPEDPGAEEKLAQYRKVESCLAPFRKADRSWNGGVNDFAGTADFRDKLTDYLKGVIKARCAALDLVGPPLTEAPRPVLLPYPSLGPLFKGRDAFLRRLRESLTAGGAASIASRAVHRLGGVGKTRAAVEYAWAHRDAYALIALLEAETPERLQTTLAALDGPLRLPSRADPDEAARFEAVLAWLNASAGTGDGWLLILDNIRRLRPRTGCWGGCPAGAMSS